MKDNIRITILLTLFSLGFNCSYSQSGNVSTGNEIKGGQGSMTYSVGQVFYHLHTSPSGSVHQGLQQPYEISVFTAQVGTDNIQISMSAYPIPVQDILILDFGSLRPNQYEFELIDVQGRSILYQKAVDIQSKISMGHLSPGTYYLNVHDAQTKVKSFKIIKH